MLPWLPRLVILDLSLKLLGYSGFGCLGDIALFLAFLCAPEIRSLCGEKDYKATFVVMGVLFVLFMRASGSSVVDSIPEPYCSLIKIQAAVIALIILSEHSKDKVRRAFEEIGPITLSFSRRRAR